VLILGAGPVGVELAGEIKEVWPHKHVTIVDPAEQLLAAFRPEMRADLHRQLKELDIQLRLGTGLTAPPANEAGRVGTFTITTTGGEEITADIWFHAHGVRVNSDYLADGRLTTRTPQGQVSVTETLNVRGYDHVYAIGDITDVAEAKMAGYAMQHAEVVAQNITAQLRDEQPTATYRPLPHPMILLPLGPRGGAGQLPHTRRPGRRPGHDSLPVQRRRPVHRPLHRTVRPHRRLNPSPQLNGQDLVCTRSRLRLRRAQRHRRRGRAAAHGATGRPWRAGHFSLSDHPYLGGRLDAYASIAFVLGRTQHLSGFANVTNLRPGPLPRWHER